MVSRKRPRAVPKIRQLATSIVYRSRRCVLRRRQAAFRRYKAAFRRGFRHQAEPPPVVKIGDAVDIFPLLGDFLIYNRKNVRHGRRYRKVQVEDIRGKPILVYMVPLSVYHFPGGLSGDTLSIQTSLKERDSDLEFEVVYVPVHRGPPFLRKCFKNRFHDILAKMPWLAVPFAKKRACQRIQDAFMSLWWVLIDGSGTVVVTSADGMHRDIFNAYGIGELVSLMHKLMPIAPTSLKHCLLRQLDVTATDGIYSLTTLLVPPYPDFLLTKDGNKVPVSIIEGKIVGLYFCNHSSTEPSRMESIKKVYAEMVESGYDFEIVQVNFRFTKYFQGNISWREDVPWLTLPYMHSCCKRLIRVFECFRDFSTYNDRDRLVIINPRKSKSGYLFSDKHAAPIIYQYGIEAYPFNLDRVFELESARREEEIKLQLIFGPPLLRPRGGGSYDQVPASHLWGKRLILVFATHSKYDPAKFMAGLKSKYLEQDDQNAFEVVYVSFDTSASTFDHCTAHMPWLVHPYSWEFASMWVHNIFTPHCLHYNSDSDNGNDSYVDSDGDDMSTDNNSHDSDNNNNDMITDDDSDIEDPNVFIDMNNQGATHKRAWCGMVNFSENGDLISKQDFLFQFYLRKEYPYFKNIYDDPKDWPFRQEVDYKYDIGDYHR